MKEEPRDSVYNRTMSEWIARVPGDLPNDAVSLWHIAAAGQHHFGLTGAELTDYLQRNIVALLDAGAIPVKRGKSTPFDWVALHQYGHEKAIVPAIISEWEASPKDEDYLFGIWFSLPSKHVGNFAP
jgi:hypothetical protein